MSKVNRFPTTFIIRSNVKFEGLQDDMVGELKSRLYHHCPTVRVISQFEPRITCYVPHAGCVDIDLTRDNKGRVELAVTTIDCSDAEYTDVTEFVTAYCLKQQNQPTCFECGNKMNPNEVGDEDPIERVCDTCVNADAMDNRSK